MAEHALKEAKSEATKYLPADVQRLEFALSDVKADFANGDDNDALSGANYVITQVQELIRFSG